MITSKPDHRNATEDIPANDRSQLRRIGNPDRTDNDCQNAQRRSGTHEIICPDQRQSQELVGYLLAEQGE